MNPDGRSCSSFSKLCAGRDTRLYDHAKQYVQIQKDHFNGKLNVSDTETYDLMATSHDFQDTSSIAKNSAQSELVQAPSESATAEGKFKCFELVEIQN